MPVDDGVPLIVNEEPLGAPVIPPGKPPAVLEMVAELLAVYIIGVIAAILSSAVWLASPLVATRVMIGMGFTVPVTASRVAETQPVVVFRACA